MFQTSISKDVEEVNEVSLNGRAFVMHSELDAVAAMPAVQDAAVHCRMQQCRQCGGT